MKTFLMSLILTISFAQLSLGASKQHIEGLVDAYYSQQITMKTVPKKALFATPLGIVQPNGLQSFPGAPVHCPPPNQGSSSECVDFACQKLGAFGCDDLSEIKQVGKACRGNFDSECIEFMCKKLGAFGCDDMNEIERVGKACVGNFGSGCISSVCSKLGAFGCDDMNEVEEVAKTCGGQD